MKPNINFYEERKDLAASFRWAERINLHEGVANHFSLAVNEDGTEFLMNPNMWHFSRIKASDLLLLNANDKSVLQKENPPDATAWGLHGAIHKNCKHARCVMHVHSIYATVLASLEEDIIIPPINQISCLFFGKQIIDTQYGGLAFEEEGQRCSNLLKDESFGMARKISRLLCLSLRCRRFFSLDKIGIPCFEEPCRSDSSSKKAIIFLL